MASRKFIEMERQLLRLITNRVAACLQKRNWNEIDDFITQKSQRYKFY